MCNKHFSFVIALAALASTNLWAQGSGAGISGSPGFQVGGNTVVATTSSNALSFVVPMGGGSVTTNTASGSVTVSTGTSGTSAITQLGGSFKGPGVYVLTDAAGNEVTIVVGDNELVSSISEGDTSANK
jgi:hypothetical protein